MTTTYAIKRAKRVKAALPAWSRIVREPLTAHEFTALAESGGKIVGPGDIHRLLGPRAAREDVEVFYAVMLNSQSRVIDVAEVTRGILNSSLVHPREVFRLAIAKNAAGIIVAHNHPSGDPTPSADDRSVTRQLVDAGKLLDIPVYDHVVLAGDKFVSFAEKGLL